MLANVDAAPARSLLAKPAVDDRLWETISPLLPPQKPRRQRYPGRRPLENRKALTGILLVLRTGIPWERLPREMAGGSGMTCWRRLRDWQRAGAWPRVHRVLLDQLPEADQLDWSRAMIDAVHARRKRPRSADAAKQPTEHHEYA